MLLSDNPVPEQFELNAIKDIEALAADLKKYNEAYRSGNPLVSDQYYDQLVEELRRLDPAHSFLHAVEPEKFESRKQVRHPVPMLSTEKAYTEEALERFVARVEKEAQAIGVAGVRFKITPKLDGLAGRDDGAVFVTRGNGEVGYEISNVFDKGVIAAGGRGRGLGELVVVKSYFDEHLADAFEHPRNMVVGIVSSDTVNPNALKALDAQAVRFVPYSETPCWTGTGRELLSRIRSIAADLIARTDYPVDGVVVEATDDRIREAMGATAHHYRWQIAFKTKGDTAVARVLNVRWQVGRTGNVTPVMEIEPVSLSGATIRHVTAHHAGLVKKHRIGPGSEIEVIRSGEVIPKLEGVISEASQVLIPDRCPSCGHPLEWNNDFLRCGSSLCRAQVVQRISHWFKTLATADWFGIKTIERIVESGRDTLEKIYQLQESDFAAMGFGPVQSRNLADSLVLSRTQPVEDWRFLAAFGISDLGTGDSRKILAHLRLKDLLDVKAEDIEKIHGFGPITSRAITADIERWRETIQHMLDLGFNLRRTPLSGESEILKNPIAGKFLVFTGRMTRGDRSQMQAEARSLGANVQSAVGRNTDFLICGENVGASKLKKAEAFGTRILTEAEYDDLIQKSRA